MFNISDRIRLISTYITGSFADIGTDHGYLAVVSHMNGNNEKMILTDISADSLSKAVNNCKFDNVSFRTGDGLDVIETGEVETVVIAGMGGKLISDIILSDIYKSRSFERFILQPRNNPGFLRERLVRNGFTITGDRLVREGIYICNVIVAGPGDSDLDYPPGDIRWEIPTERVDCELFAEYIEMLIRRETKIIKGLEKSRDQVNEADSHRMNIEVLKEVLI